MNEAKRTVRLLILDLDGTLIDSAPGIIRTFNATLIASGLSPVPDEDVKTMIGLPLGEMYRRFLPAHHWPELEAWQAAYRAQYSAVEIPRTRAFPGVAQTLNRWRAAGGRAAVATSKRQAVALRAIEAAGLLPLLDLVLGEDQVTRKKPEAEMALRILEAEQCPPDLAVVVGDTTHDVQMGKAAALHTAAVSYGVHRREVLTAAGADLILDRFEDLLQHWAPPRGLSN